MIENIYACDDVDCTKKSTDLKGWFVVTNQSATSSLKLEWHFCCEDHLAKKYTLNAKIKEAVTFLEKDRYQCGCGEYCPPGKCYNVPG